MDRAGIDLEQLGRETAKAILRADQVRGVRVETVFDVEDEFAYVFSILTDRGSDSQLRARTQTRLALRLIDELTARGDLHFPMIEFPTEEEWTGKPRA